MYFSKNIKLLRNRAKKSQELVAEGMGIPRASLAGYETRGIEPDYRTLIKFSEYFRISVDNLLKADLEKVPESLLGEMERSQDIDLSGRKLRILATTVNENNEDNVELVPVKARAGYTAGYSDPDYIKVLQSFNMPFLDRSRKYRTFPVNGDSMPPVAHGSWVTGEYVQNWSHIKSGYPHIIVTRDEGIVFKILYNKIAESRSLLLVSTNPLYNPYEVNISEVLEIWKFVHYISNEMPASDFSTANILSSAMQNIEKEIKVIKNTLREKN